MGESKIPIKILRFYSAQHADTLSEWIGDQEITRYMASGRILGEYPANEWEAKSDRDFVFAVYHGLAYVGVVGLYGHDVLSQKAELRILIGHNRGHGLGTEAVRLLLEFGFGTLNLHRIYLGTATENKAAIRAFEKNGFRPEGVLVEDLYRNGRWHDNVRMAVLRRNWEADRAQRVE